MSTACLVIAFVLFLIAAFGGGVFHAVALVPLGLAFWVAASLVPLLRRTP